MIPAVVLGSGGDESTVRPNYAVVLPPTADALRGCALGCGVEPTQLQLAAKLSDTPAPTAPPSVALGTDATEPPEAESVVSAMPTMVIREGDTLLDLAVWFDVTPWEIAVANGMSVDDYLTIGAQLAIPVDAYAFVIPPDPLAYVAAVEVDAPAGVEEPEPVYAAVPQPTPVPPPQPTVRPFVPPPARADVAAIICSFPWPCDQMVRIANCESGLNPGAVNPAGYYGLFQIAGEFPGWDDAYTNALVAYEQKYLPSLNRGGDGLAPWPVCRYY